jgi:trimeric autotransporter adhesin
MINTSQWRIATCAAALVFGMASISAYAAPEIGVAAAVNPQATGHPTGGAARTIVLGEKLTFNERVETSEGGLVQVLLLDGSTFTVGPNSDLVIDQFVYDPATGKGKLVASFSKGVMRFIGGKLSKNEGGVQVRTPVGLMGIRGGVADVQIAGSNSGFFSMIFGEELSLLGPDGNLRRVLEAGYAIDVTQGLSGPIEIRQVTESEAKLFISQLSGKVGTSGGAAQTPTSQTVQNSGVSSQGSDTDPDATGPGSRADAVQSEQASNLHQDTLSENTIIARKQMRVLSTGSQYTVAGKPSIDPTGTGVVGAAPGDPAGADQQAEFAVNLRLAAKATLQQGQITVPYPILEGTYIVSGVPSPFGTLSGTVMFGPNLDFTFYRLFANGDLTKPVYIIGGNATPEAKLIGTGDVQRYKLGQDIIQQIDIPFVTGGTVLSGGTLQNDTSTAFVSDLFLVRPDGVRYDAAPGAIDTPVALQASLQIDGSGASQVSTLVLGVGATGDAIYRFGGTRQASDQRTTSFSGGLDLIKGANDTEFFGPDGTYAIVGPNLDGGQPFIDTPDQVAPLSLDQLVSATIHVAVFDSQTQFASLDRTLGTLTGFAAGMVEKVGTTDVPLPYRGTSSADLVIEFDPDNNTLGGALTVRDVADLDPDIESIKVAYGDDGPSAMVDDNIFAAGANPTLTETVLTEQDGSDLPPRRATPPPLPTSFPAPWSAMSCRTTRRPAPASS